MIRHYRHTDPYPGVSIINLKNMDAFQVELTAADVKEIEDGFAKIRMQGAVERGGTIANRRWRPAGHGFDWRARDIAPASEANSVEV